MPTHGRRRPCRRTASVTVGVVATLAVAACGPGLPTSVVEGSGVTVGWSESVTSLNAATTDGETAGNRAIAQVTHDAFARVADGDVVLDESFGTVEIVEDPDSFTVRYDLADRSWSDEVPLDAADLLLAWAAGSNATAGGFDSRPGDLQQSTEVPTYDDFERSIDVSYAEPVREWQTVLDVAVPAHVVGQMAFGIEDPMEAKQAVVDAIVDGADADLIAVADVWNSAFELDPDDPEITEALTVASGAYRVRDLERTEQGDEVTLEVNRSYGGEVPPTYEDIRVVPDDTLASFPDALDVVQLRPTPDNFEVVRDLERRDHHLSITNDGRLWVLVLRADGFFGDRDARSAFLRAAPASDLRSGGAGDWEEAFATTQSLLFQPGSDGYDIALEDAGFRTTLGTASSEPAADRRAAGVPGGTEVCVLYDTDETFAAGAFTALRGEVAEAGWDVTDCGESDIATTLGQGDGWQALLTTVPIPDSPAEITETWGGEEGSPYSNARNPERGRLAAELARTADVYDARELQVEIEAGLLEDAVALPLAVDPLLTLSAREMDPVFPESGSLPTLLSGAATWGPET